ncbi:hypothetical protein [Actinomycetospora aeridis]|uniref:Uncharacterized protein n=1 Tax=Actinomycetospora aeridis TaxID=3129231 RepID=A0ABU8N9P5_9PSEU
MRQPASPDGVVVPPPDGADDASGELGWDVGWDEGWDVGWDDDGVVGSGDEVGALDDGVLLLAAVVPGLVDPGGVVPGEVVPGEVVGRPVPDGREGRSPPRTTGAGRGPASGTRTTTGPGAELPAAGAAAAGGGAGRGWRSARRSRSATVGLIVVDDGSTGAAATGVAAAHGRGLSSSCTALGIPMAVEAWVVVW